MAFPSSLKKKKKTPFVFTLRTGDSPACVCEPCVYNTSGSQKRAPDPPGTGVANSYQRPLGARSG